jgi:hypothetical protein
VAYAKRGWAKDVMSIPYYVQETETGSAVPTDFIPFVSRYDQGGALDLTM